MVAETERAHNWITERALAALTAAEEERRRRNEEEAAARQAEALAQREAEALVVAGRLIGWLDRPVALGRDLAVGSDGYAWLGDVPLTPHTSYGTPALRVGTACPTCGAAVWHDREGYLADGLVGLGAALRAVAQIAENRVGCYDCQRTGRWPPALPVEEEEPAVDEGESRPRVQAGWVEIAPGVWVRAAAVVAIEGRKYETDSWSSTVHLAGAPMEDGVSSPWPVEALRRALLDFDRAALQCEVQDKMLGHLRRPG